MGRKRKMVKSGKKQDYTKSSFIDMPCSMCGAETKTSEETKSVICFRCVCKLVPCELPKKSAVTTKKEDGFPRGWHFHKEFVHKDGRVFHRGVEMPNLKGKKKPTPLEPKEKLTKFDRRKRKEEKEIKKMKRLAKKFKMKEKAKKKEKKG